MSNRTGLILDFGGVLTTPLLPAVLEFERREGLSKGACINALYADESGLRITGDLERGVVSQEEWNTFAGKILGVRAEGLMGRIFGTLRPEPLMINAAAAARKAGIKVGILSNSVGLKPWDLYAGYDLEQLYDLVVISEQHLMRKPDRELFELTLKLMDLPAEECVFVDDTKGYVQAAEQLGIAGVHNEDPAQTVATLSELLGVDLTAS
ncbi:HAD-IA family hydrolase [Streptomyces sp. NPDC056528]|uniref:HAD-IA family hydrolase n=1 Tax=Streptomyces sp. NPDC056528 TaxID=3345854 RepID=UPI003686C2C9